MRFFLFLLGAILVGIRDAGAAGLGKSESGTQPNIIFVLADDYGFNDIGYHGSEIQTPVLDSLASGGVKLENYYVQPVCSPTRSQLMTGRYQIHTGLQHGVIEGWQRNAVPISERLLPQVLKDAGYSTHMVGKWHLGFYSDEFLPYNRGFDSYFGYLQGSEHYFTHDQHFVTGKTLYLDLRNKSGPVHSMSGQYSAQMLTTEAEKIVRSHNSSQPLFMYLAYQSVHAPLEVPEHYKEIYKNIKDKRRRTYAGMVSALDEGVGNLTQALHDSGMWNNTILIFSTDNGGEIHQGGNNFPLRGWKHSLWEGGVRGVGFVSGGKLVPSGVINHELLHVSDWFPTIVGLAKGSLNGTKPLDGFDQWNTISLGAPSKRKVLLHNIDPLTNRSGLPLYNGTFDSSVRAALRVGDLKLITGDPGNSSWIPPPGHPLQFVPENRDHAAKNVWLFNITADPNEHNDLSNQMPDTVRSMLDILAEFNKTAVPCRYPPVDPESNPALHGGVWGPWV